MKDAPLSTVTAIKWISHVKGLAQRSKCYQLLPTSLHVAVISSAGFIPSGCSEAAEEEERARLGAADLGFSLRLIVRP